MRVQRSQRSCKCPIFLCLRALLLKVTINSIDNLHYYVLRCVLPRSTRLAVTASSLCWPAATQEMFPLSRRTALCLAPHNLAQMLVRSIPVPAPRLATSVANLSQTPAHWTRTRFIRALETRLYPKRRMPVPRRPLVLRLHQDRLVRLLTVFARTTAPIVVLRLLLSVI